MRQAESITGKEPDPVMCPSCGTKQRWTEYERRGRMIWAYPPVKRLTPPVGSEEEGENPLACPVCEEETRDLAVKKLISRRLAMSGVPERFRGYTLDRAVYQENGEHPSDFRLRVRGEEGVYGVCHEDHEAFRSCLQWVQYMKGGKSKLRGIQGPKRHKRGASLYIHGPVGVGKTLLAVVLLSELVKGGHKVPVSESDYAEHLSAKSGVSLESAMKDVEASRCEGRPIAWTAERSYTAKFIEEGDLIAAETLSWKGNPSPLFRFTKHRGGPVVIDDFDSDGGGQKGPREFVVRSLERVIQYRHSRRLTTILTSNTPPGKIREVYGDRVASRLREVYEPIQLTGGGDEWRR
tara:strand:- start:1228 stop:2277 length:1050 start_codon:yes stop_codon:yes gene_type:complete